MITFRTSFDVTWMPHVTKFHATSNKMVTKYPRTNDYSCEYLWMLQWLQGWKAHQTIFLLLRWGLDGEKYLFVPGMSVLIPT